jgi:cytochrome d ubiquinol oxidase subunit I
LPAARAMNDAAGMDLMFWHRLQFGFTAAFHYLFPQLTMGLALLIVVLKVLETRTGDAKYAESARFWIRIFGINFAVGVVTGIPMEFQFGTNWARFTAFSGGVVGNTLGMEGMFAFFLESAFLSILVWGERRFPRAVHSFAVGALFVGSWLSGYFIVATNAFLQHPVGYRIVDGTLQMADFWAFLLNPWALIEYVHTMIASVVTASFVMAAVGAYYVLTNQSVVHARVFLKVGILAGLVSSLLVAFPTGDAQAKLIAVHRPVALAAMEGRFASGNFAELTIIGQPDIAHGKIDNPIAVPGVLSFIAYGSFDREVRGLNDFAKSERPTNPEMLYYGFHVMVGLGTILIALMAVAAGLMFTKRLEKTRWLLWILMLAFPFPYIANIAGWMVTELGRQPWIIVGVLHTIDGTSALVHPGQTIFTLLGFAGLYFVLGLLFLFLVMREVQHGPSHADAESPAK